LKRDLAGDNCESVDRESSVVRMEEVTDRRLVQFHMENDCYTAKLFYLFICECHEDIMVSVFPK